MSYQDSLVYYYLTTKQKMTNIYNRLFVYLIGISNFKIIVNDKTTNIFHWYLMYNFLTKLINFTAYIKKGLISLRNKVDIDAEKMHITKVAYEGEKTIIIDKNLSENKNNVKLSDVIDQINNIKPDDNMMPTSILTFELVNPEDQKVCLKGLVVQYKDLECMYHHTLKNILDFNNIGYVNESKLKIKLIKDRKIISDEKDFKDICDLHINKLLQI
ncbi:hypothetical protein QKU48_gp0575 [Fadolivirus algeromassiliense]|jgi:hypothetical protein|uniref:Uncharacterized protein n=1 Tax=Fadolivirus FV1/VV64 TaxID=3070911 RepID=A0A7D3UQR9_9VIRU|nr:hypothetical protein QKU48_gp0575 [Fadolivirus algeromassiliense]QKF94033.1 hypothetical protein Fadolivirus_1_575 [Fadolivirus FV1/VV64]